MPQAPVPNALADSVLSIIIPALNEEEAIRDTVRRCLEARDAIRQKGGVRDVEVIVVNDGSTDRTEEIARESGVTVLSFDRNRGYGAAIQCGFAHARGDLLGFVDADGTCDPRFFADLCRRLARDHADVALGSRMGRDSRMPFVRTAGNTIFAWILGLLSKHAVRDTASGMRVIRRDRLDDLYPLPDGLHFTPAMSARILLEDRLRLVEVDMPYAERVGRSKLSVVRDGIRFLNVIVRAAMCYRPARPLLLGAAAVSIVAFGTGIGPTLFYLTEGRLEEWMVYRVLFSSLCVTLAALIVCSAVVADRIAATVHDRPFAARGVSGLLERLFTRRFRVAGSVLLSAGAIGVVWPGLVQYVTEGVVEMHWSRAVLGALLVVIVAVMHVTALLLQMTSLMRAHRNHTVRYHSPDRVYRGAA